MCKKLNLNPEDEAMLNSGNEMEDNNQYELEDIIEKWNIFWFITIMFIYDAYRLF